MIATNGYCSFCDKHADQRGGLYRPRPLAMMGICVYCARVALREFGESEPCSNAHAVVPFIRPDPNGGNAA